LVDIRQRVAEYVPTVGRPATRRGGVQGHLHPSPLRVHRLTAHEQRPQLEPATDVVFRLAQVHVVSTSRGGDRRKTACDVE